MGMNGRGVSTAPATVSGIEPADTPEETFSRGVVEPGREAEFLNLLLANLDLGISILDEDLRYKMISAGVYRQLGLGPEALGVDSTLGDCHALMQRSGLLTEGMIRKAKMSADEQRDLAKRGERYDGGLVTLGDGSTHRHSRMVMGNGYTLSIATDVSELVEKDHLLEGALVLGQSGYWIYDFATRHYSMSQSFENYLGAEMSERVLRDGIIHCVIAEDRARYRDAIASLKDGNTKFRVDGRVRARNGEVRWSRSVGELIRDPNGRPLRIRAFVRDIHEMRTKEEELERAKDDAIAASQAKSEFLANMSHEIRTPMNGVLGMAELLANSAIDERQREYVNVINSSANALLNIINDILDFSKIEAGAFDIDPMPFDLRGCIADVTALLVASAQEKDLELIIDYPEDLPRNFIGDAGRIRQILTNLVGNAIKFTEGGYVRTTVGVRQKGDTAIISLDVEDTGIGIPPQKIDRVFDKFTQADGSTTRVYGGTGLGLTITKRIVEMMNGRVGVRSELGTGSTFSVRLPLPIDTQARTETFDTGVLADKRVLIVDDIDVNCRVLRRQLGNWGMEADCAHDGVQAVETLMRAAREGQPYDLVLLDYLMPGINGRELASMLSARTDLVVPPLIMLSSCDQSVSSQELARTGIQSYLVKPVRERRLYDTVVRVLSNPPASLTAKPPASLPANPAATPAAHPSLQTSARPDPSTLATPGATTGATPIAPPPVTVLETPEATGGPGVEVLVAEDFPLNQDVVRLMLNGSAFRPVFAENGEVAVRLFTEAPERFPIILMDVSMPVRDGYMATRDIRAWEAKRNRAPVPIIALTGHALKSDRQECLAAGMNDYLTKPVKQVALLDMLERCSGRVRDAA